MPPKVLKQKKRPWTKDHEKTFTWLYNYMQSKYDNVDKENFIEMNKRELMSIIEKNPAWGNSSMESMFFMIARYLYNKNNNDRYVKLYQSKGKELIDKTAKETGKNELDEKEKINYRPYEYFKNILDNYEKPTTLREHYKYLLLSLLVLQPPVRTDFYSSASLLQTLDRNNHKDNYIYINRRGKVHAYYFINKDKASNYKLYSMDKSLSKIEIKNEVLANLLNDSFKEYPRKYLFELNNKGVADTTLNKWLQSVTGLPGINFSMMRSIYITWFYKNNQLYNSREELARQMRHSQPTASKNYLKIFDEEKLPPSQETEKLKKENLKMEHEHQLLKGELLKVKMEEGDQLYNKRRSDILYRINKKNVTPKSSTLEKYNISFNTETKLYS